MSADPTSTAIAYPLQQSNSAATESQTLDFLIKAALLHARTAHPVQVVAVHGGGVGSPPTVDVQPLVSQINGIGQGQQHGTVYGRPCFRLQGGGSAVILDPVKNDIGLLVCCDRDISNVVASLAVSLPASLRKFNFADGIYIGGILNAGAPSQYVQLAAGVNVQSPALAASGNLSAGSGGEDVTFTTTTGQTITVQGGVVTNASLGTSPINAAYFNNLTAQVNAATSCAELQAIATKAITSANAALASASAQLATITPMLALLTAPTASLGSIVTWITSLISEYLTPQLIPATTLAAQVAQMTVAIAELTAAITSAAGKFESCTITIP